MLVRASSFNQGMPAEKSLQGNSSFQPGTSGRKVPYAALSPGPLHARAVLLPRGRAPPGSLTEALERPECTTAAPNATSRRKARVGAAYGQSYVTEVASRGPRSGRERSSTVKTWRCPPQFSVGGASSMGTLNAVADGGTS